jgi:hypothetical protein
MKSEEQIKVQIEVYREELRTLWYVKDNWGLTDKAQQALDDKTQFIWALQWVIEEVKQ